MMEESLPSIWASMHSWFTPTVLFILINVVIGTIFFSSTARKQENDDDNNKKKLSRTSSVLERLRSFNLYRQNTQEIPPLTTTLDPPNPSVCTAETLGSEEPPTRLPMSGSGTDPTRPEEEAIEAAVEESESHLGRNRSDTHPTAGERPEKLAQKMKKSASAKSAFGHLEEEEIVEAVKRPATMREKRMVGEDDEVDRKADDFINMFKEQLKLQRLDSPTRFNRGK